MADSPCMICGAMMRAPEPGGPQFRLLCSRPCIDEWVERNGLERLTIEEFADRRAAQRSRERTIYEN